MGLLQTLRFITSHPMTQDRRMAAVGRFMKWQIQCRLQDEVIHNWIGGAKIAARKGMTGATGNIYCGLHEYADMSFVLDVLRPGDLFVDIGANIGSYTILAAAVAGANVIAFEPDPDTVDTLRRNVEVNKIGDKVQIYECALGEKRGSVEFTVGRDTVNQVASPSDTNTRRVPLETLDHVLDGRAPTVMKLDVEGYESQVLAGASKTLLSDSLIAVETEDCSESTREQLTRASFIESFYDPVSRRLERSALWQASNTLFVKDASKVQRRTVGANVKR